MLSYLDIITLLNYTTFYTYLLNTCFKHLFNFAKVFSCLC